MPEPRSVSRTRAEGAPPPRRRAALWVALAGVVVLGAIAALFLIFKAETRKRLELPIEIPESRPTGDPVPIAYGVKPGDVFVTEARSKNRLVTALAQAVETKEGMQFDATIIVGHQVAARPQGGTSSTIHAFRERVVTHVPEIDVLMDTQLGDRGNPYEVTFDRDEKGRPIRSTQRPPPRTKAVLSDLKRLAVDVALSGLGDLATNYLPARDVRLGEAWDFAEVSDSLPGVEAIFRRVSQRQDAPEGYPPVEVKARLQAVAREPFEGEDCLRLRLAASLTMNGETHPPAYVGYISGAATIDGSIWVSVATGIVWGIDAKTAILSSYRNETLPPQERRSEGTLVAKTRRADRMP
jgi:hypothetical protein